MNPLLSRPAALLPALDGNAEATGLRRRILVVDDDPVVLDVVSEILERLDVDIETCLDPEAALLLFEGTSFDVVISDDTMPKMSGRDMLARVRSRRPETPTILMTGYGTPEKVEEAYERSGVFGFVHKPWNNSQLLEAVQDALTLRNTLR
jgi:DNA-binding NtrC family response regulator